MNWMISLHRIRDRNTRLEVHHVGFVPDWFFAAAKQFDAHVMQIQPFGKGPAVYCNKLQQFERLLTLSADIYVLSDADIAFLSSPSKWGTSNAVRAKIVDAPNPPETVLKALLERAGFPAETLDSAPDWYLDKRTHRLNCNGGLYVLTRNHLSQLQRPWRKWAQFCLEQEKLLGPKLRNSDQLGFLLAMLELKLPFDPLPIGANFPVHFGPERYCGRIIRDVSGLHYHGHLDRDGNLSLTGATMVDPYVVAANRIISARIADTGRNLSDLRTGKRSRLWSVLIGNKVGVANDDITAMRRKLGRAAWRRRRAAKLWKDVSGSNKLYFLRRLLKGARSFVFAVRNVALNGNWLALVKQSKNA